jgi:hypothetical protein
MIFRLLPDPASNPSITFSNVDRTWDVSVTMPSPEMYLLITEFTGSAD